MAFVEVSKQGHVGIVTMNRPETLNALSSAVFADLLKAFDVVENDEEIYVVVVTGAGRSFVAGADISEMATMNVVEGKNFGDLGNQAMLRLERMEKPTIAAINGFALGGGCELSMACDIRIASEKAKFGQPEVGLGITPGFGGTQRLARTVGVSNAMELILTAQVIPAARAKEIGLVSHVYAPEELLDKALELANAIAANAQIAVRQSKAAIRRGMQTDVITGAAFESEAFGLCFATEDQKDAMRAFVNKEKLSGFKVTSACGASSSISETTGTTAEGRHNVFLASRSEEWSNVSVPLCLPAGRPFKSNLTRLSRIPVLATLMISSSECLSTAAVAYKSNCPVTGSPCMVSGTTFVPALWPYSCCT